jgi:hypothetical protein
MTEILQAALEYARRGWPVLPCRVGTKLPMTKHGSHDATSDAELIRSWWLQWPAANVGVATGPESGLYVIDEDQGGAETIASLALPPTFTIRTPSGGRHFYFRLPDGVDLGNSAKTKLGPGVDTRGRGGYVVAPPSVVAGSHYAVEVDTEIAPLPAHIIARLQPPPRAPQRPPVAPRAATGYGERALAEELARVEGALEGTRNDCLNTAAFSLGQLVGGGVLDGLRVRDELRRAAAQAGLGEMEVERTINSGLSAGMQQPRTAPEPQAGRAAAPKTVAVKKPKITAEPTLVVTMAADVKLEHRRWLWKDRLAFGAFAILDGDPGLGKSSIAIDIAARVTRGDIMPDGSPGAGEPATVLFLLGEDDCATCVGRLAAAGADLQMVHIIEGRREPGESGHRSISIPEDLPAIEQHIRLTGAAMLVIDPWFAFLDGAIDADRDKSSRLALTPTTKMAEATGSLVWALRHWKKGAGSAIHRGMSSVAHSAAARSVLAVGADQSDQEGKRHILAVVKNNWGKKGASMLYAVEGTTQHRDGTPLVDEQGHPIETNRIEWHGTTDTGADELSEKRDEDGGAVMLEEAVTFLRSILSEGPRAVRDIRGDASGAGMSWRTIERAKAKIGVEAIKKQFSGAWEWTLPANTANEPCAWRAGGLGGLREEQDRQASKTANEKTHDGGLGSVDEDSYKNIRRPPSNSTFPRAREDGEPYEQAELVALIDATWGGDD